MKKKRFVRVMLVLIAAAIWLTSAMEYGFVSGRWAERTSLVLVVLLWVVPAYYLWSSKQRDSAAERKEVRRFRRMAEAEEKREFLKKIAA